MNLQIKNTLIYVLSEMKGFKFVTTLVLEFKKIENDDEAKCTVCVITQKQ